MLVSRWPSEEIPLAFTEKQTKVANLKHLSNLEPLFLFDARERLEARAPPLRAHLL
jgi:hypothetical protein